ncbi:MAG: endonuclease [Paludibacter sp.]|nr:endonuclease [Bacteroidales bacterium]MCM1068996.1 endonuclease [Prevotella sp.]MCM1353659.1 endonuclease [Bacteroides sp.]MCM1441992.1 endonuclease [Muribaculum sp.]MCM1481552.1 endonuclease [Paludibacter sp.]
MKCRLLYIAFLILGCCYVAGQTTLRIVGYNVENLFDTRHDSLKQDTEFTPDGERRWNYTRYQNKLQQIARVVANIGEWNVPALVGLCEVENKQCLEDLCKGALRNYQYRYIHQDSPDVRGIDCALLYDAKQFKPIKQHFIPIELEGRPTRDIVYAAGIVGNTDTLHVFLCHFPSQRGGASSTASRRQIALQTLQDALDTLFTEHPEALVVVMGDFNAEAADNLKGMYNKMLPFEEKGCGTYKYQGVWKCLDQFYVSPCLRNLSEAFIYDASWLQEDDTHFLGTRPRRTYQGFRYQESGYSDHLPIYMNIHF